MATENKQHYAAYNSDQSVSEKLEISQTEQVCDTIEQLIRYARAKRMLGAMDCPYARNSLLELFHLTEPSQSYSLQYDTVEEELNLQELLKVLLDYGHTIGLLPDRSTTQRDLLDARIMGFLTPRPSETAARFQRLAAEQGIQQATDDFYALNVDSNYIRMDRVSLNDEWEYSSEFGDIQMTINVSKPEKSPQEIAQAKLAPQSSYPQCLLCADNVGYAGRVNHPARQNLRIIPLQLNEEDWFFQYSPYVYYNEHSIVFRREHLPMKLTESSFKRLLLFTEQFPHYFIGSNADLPIVGGSILSHDHFQAGNHTFPIELAAVDETYQYPAYDGVKVSIVNWPMSVMRMTGEDQEQLLQAVNAVFEAWKQYSDPEVGIYAYSDVDGERIPHNTVTPIVRRRGSAYEVDVVLRNNRTSSEHPEGIFHPHREMHHIKQENIGLIEVMGLAILPPRLLQSISSITKLLTGEESWAVRRAAVTDTDHLYAHRDWIDALLEQYGSQLEAGQAEQVIRQDIGRIFVEILGHAGVYKRDSEGQLAFRKFMNQLGLVVGS